MGLEPDVLIRVRGPTPRLTREEVRIGDDGRDRSRDLRSGESEGVVGVEWGVVY